MTCPPGPYGYGYAPPPPPPKPGVIPLAPLDLNHVLGGAFAAYRRHWKALLGVTLAAHVLAGLVAAGLAAAGWAALSGPWREMADAPSTGDAELSDLTPFFLGLGGLWLAFALAVLLATGLVHAAVAVVVQEAVLGRRIGFGAVWRRSWSRLGAVLGTVVLSALAGLVPMLLLLLGFCFMVVATLASVGSDSGDGVGPALTALLLMFLAFGTTPFVVWIWVKFSLAPTAAVVESAGVLTAMRRSAELVRGSWWRIFGYTLVMLLIVGGVSFVVQTAVSVTTQASVFAVPLAQHATPGTLFLSAATAAAVGGLLQLLTQLLLGPLQPLTSGLLYVDQRIRKENLAPVLARAAASG
ncbi:oxidoreductase [Streptomyces filamentosus]|uniref:oxidoreductase n=1 Tax=Streptomyces filamentosus TaxID=67294 RepID=UPI00123B4D3E|nr:oxidoreductase [Streptomyces filamentosus]